MFKTITANVWLGKGIHHLLHCTNGATSYDISNACSLDNMKFSYPLSNNVKFNFAPLDCALSSTWGT